MSTVSDFDWKRFEFEAQEAVRWIRDYYETLPERAVTSSIQPYELLKQFPAKPPAQGEPFSKILTDFQNQVVPHMTHWQHPKFFAYFPGQSSPPSMLADLLISALGAQCMSWITSPAGTELELKMMEWLRDFWNLPADWGGVIQHSASDATFVAILAARETATRGEFNRKGFSSRTLTAYASEEAHSSIEKAVRMAGIGSENLRKIPVDSRMALRVDELEKAIRQDQEKGYLPFFVCGALGSTGSCSIDPLLEIAKLKERYSFWFHVDGAYAGSALCLPNIRRLAAGIEAADTVVINPHKWLLTTFDCSAFFMKEPAKVEAAMSILPEYLRTAVTGRAKDLRDYSPSLGRRFRALKLWFVFRYYGGNALAEMLRDHIAMATEMERRILQDSRFELLLQRNLNVLCFRYTKPGLSSDDLNELNAKLLEELNSNHTLFLTHTKLHGKFTIRWVIGSWTCKMRHVLEAWEEIQAKAN